MSLRILAIAEIKAPLEIPAFLPSPQRRDARRKLEAIAAQIHQLENSPARTPPAGDARPRPVVPATRAPMGGAAPT